MATPTSTTTLHVPAVLRAACGGARTLTLAGGTVRDAFAALERTHPDLYRSICDETGAVRRHVGLFVNTTHVRDLAGLDTSLEPGDSIVVLPAVSGG